MNIEKRQISQLHPADYNPRKDLQQGDAEYEKIRNSIEAFGYVDPIIINSDGTIIGGHQRWKVLRDLGYAEVDCVVVDVDKTKEKALNVALNKISGEFDNSMLSVLLKDIQSDIDLALTGFDAWELERLIIDALPPDDEDEFDEYDEKISTEHKCPKCGYEW